MLRSSIHPSVIKKTHWLRRNREVNRRKNSSLQPLSKITVITTTTTTTITMSDTATTIKPKRLSDQIRETQRKKLKSQSQRSEWDKCRDIFDIEKLNQQLLQYTEANPTAKQFELKFNTPELPGFTPIFGLNPSGRLTETVLFWKSWEIENGIRVKQSADHSGLSFTWLADDGSNQTEWKEPAVEELLTNPEYSDALSAINKAAAVPAATEPTV